MWQRNATIAPQIIKIFRPAATSRPSGTLRATIYFANAIFLPAAAAGIALIYIIPDKRDFIKVKMMAVGTPPHKYGF